MFAAAVLVTGCGSSPDIACDEVRFSDVGTVTIHVCTEVVDFDPSRIDAQKQLCKNAGGLLLDACPIANQLGVCSSIDRGIPKESHFYPTTSVTSAELKAACESSNGTWTEG